MAPKGLIQHDSVDVCFCFLLTEIDPLKKLTQTLKIDENSQFLVESNLPTSNPLSGRVYVNFGGGVYRLETMASLLTKQAKHGRPRDKLRNI